MSNSGGELNYPYVIFQLFDYKCAVSCEYVVLIEQASEINGTANIINLRELFSTGSQNDCAKNPEHNIILQIKDKKIGITVDNAESVDYIDEIQELPQSVVMTKYIKKIGLTQKDKKAIFILEAEELYS